MPRRPEIGSALDLVGTSKTRKKSERVDSNSKERVRPAISRFSCYFIIKICLSPGERESSPGDKQIFMLFHYYNVDVSSDSCIKKT